MNHLFPRTFTQVSGTPNSSSTTSTTRYDDTTTSSLSSKHNLESRDVARMKTTTNNIMYKCRKEFLSFIVTTSSSLVSTMVLKTSPARAATDATDHATGSTPTDTATTTFTSAQIQKFLQPIPTFAIVDQSGVPFMVVGEDAKLSAYFFTSFDEAQRILTLASESSKKAIQEATKDENAKRKARGEKPLRREEMDDVIGINPWVGARISSVPLDFASGLAFKGKVRGAYFRIAPSERDIEDAMELDNLDDLAEGKVPLFYVEDFEIGLKAGEELWSGANVFSSEDSRGEQRTTKIPLYFSKEQLVQDWKRFNPGKRKLDDSPEIKVTELFSLLTEMVTGQGSKDELAKLVLVPPRGSEAKAKACLKRGGNESPYKLGERIIAL